MTTAKTLQIRTRRELEVLARRKRIAGIRAMSKDELIEAIACAAGPTRSTPPRAKSLRGAARAKQGSASSASGRGRSATTSPRRGRPPNGARSGNGHNVHTSNGHGTSAPRLNGHKTNGRTINGQASKGPPTNGHVNGSVSSGQAKPRRDSHVFVTPSPSGQDRLFARAVDAHWFDVRWSLTSSMLRRAEAFFGLDWRHVRPVIRIYDVTSDDGSTTSRAFVRDEPLTDQADRWFVRVPRPDCMWLFEIGLISRAGRFFPLAHGEPIGAPGPLSRIRRTGGAGGHDRSSGEEMSPVSSLIPQLVRAANRRSAAHEAEDGRTEPDVVQLQAELVVHGKADPVSELRLMKDRIPLTRDGTFTFRLPLENGRVVIPVEHVSPDGSEQRTVILAIERSTRVLETQLLDETAE